MEAVFRTKFDESEVEEINKFVLLADYFAVEQAIGFPEILYRTNINYFLLKEQDKILSFCQVYENFKFAHIWYGPVSNDREYVIRSINEIVLHYKKRGFWYLGVQMYLKTGSDCDYIEYQLNRIHKIKYLFDNQNTKSSLEIDLGQSLEEISGNFRKGHKSDIKKAINFGISVESVTDAEDIKAFCSVYRKMCNTRSIRGHTATEVERIVNYLITNHMGKLMVARDSGHAVIGGSIFTFQGISVRYLLSASDPEKRDLPVTHIIIYRALEMAKALNFRYFDFWGYNHFADKNDQIYKVNSFKKGFGGYFTFLAKKMNINLIPGGYNIFRFFGVMKKMRNKFV